jgi:hypothetical protein
MSAATITAPASTRRLRRAQLRPGEAQPGAVRALLGTILRLVFGLPLVFPFINSFASSGMKG